MEACSYHTRILIVRSTPIPEDSTRAVSSWRGFEVCLTTGELKWFQASEVHSSGVSSSCRRMFGLCSTTGVRSARGDLTAAPNGIGVLSSCVPLDWTDFAAGGLELVDFEVVAAFREPALIWTDLVWRSADLPRFSWPGDLGPEANASTFAAADERLLVVALDSPGPRQTPDVLFRLLEYFSFQSSHANLIDVSSLIAINTQTSIRKNVRNLQHA